ncbi:MAG: hypothetical protein GY835_20920 [bacterium]|nr:hypothetical protein [bacterium]
MALINRAGQEISAKIVYYGPGLSGKTTNLEIMFKQVPETNRGKMISMKTRTDRTLFFDLLPINSEPIHDFQVRILLYTVPGQVYYNATRRLVLKGVDAVVFVADSQRDKLQENIESLENLRANLTDMGISVDEIPWVIQYNKRDLPDVMSIDELQKALNPMGVPTFEAVASRGDGVQETMRGVVEFLRPGIQSQVEAEIGMNADNNASDSGAMNGKEEAVQSPREEIITPDSPPSDMLNITREQAESVREAPPEVPVASAPPIQADSAPVAPTPESNADGQIDTIMPEIPEAPPAAVKPEMPTTSPITHNPMEVPSLVMMPGDDGDVIAPQAESSAVPAQEQPSVPPEAAETPATTASDNPDVSILKESVQMDAPEEPVQVEVPVASQSQTEEITPEPPRAAAPTAPRQPAPTEIPALIMMPGDDGDYTPPAPSAPEEPRVEPEATGQSETENAEPPVVEQPAVETAESGGDARGEIEVPVTEKLNYDELPEPKIVEYPGPNKPQESVTAAQEQTQEGAESALADKPQTDWSDNGATRVDEPDWVSEPEKPVTHPPELVVSVPKNILESGELRLRIVLAADGELGEVEAKVELVDQH